MISTFCRQCGKEFKVYRCWLRDGKGIFCSRACQHLGKKKKLRTILFAICKECGRSFEYRKGRGGTYEFCSSSCRAIGCGKRLRGGNHPFWNGGSSKRTYSSKRAIKLAIRAAGCCARCGNRENLHGHHKIHYAVDESKRDDIANIEVLCGNCHAAAHPDLAGMLSVPRVRSGVYKNCLECPASFYVPQFKKYTAKFCSRECQLKALHRKTRQRYVKVKLQAEEENAQIGVCTSL